MFRLSVHTLAVSAPAQGEAMAICIDCKRDMTVAAGCTLPTVVIDGIPRPRIRWGREAHWPRSKDRCGDCHVVPGQLHHLGCDLEECPACRQQLLSCGCWHDGVDEDEDEDDELGAWGEDLEDESWRDH
jgi:hypothetical protein